MSWRTLMKAEIQPDPTFPDLQETSTKYTKPCGQASESPNQDNFVDIVDDMETSDPRKWRKPSLYKAQTEEAPLHVGQTVRCRVPVDINGPRDYQLAEYIGLLEMIDYANHLALVAPDDVTIAWQWVSLTYVEPYNGESS